MAPRRRPHARLGGRVTVARLASGPPLDAVIVGGGINGCAIAREAAGRGLRVALFEQDDFGFGTTWRSTKLIHGGLRYLEHGDVRLVFESLSERAWLLKTRPHLVRKQRFLLPLLPWTRRPAWQLSAGLTLYDVLALYRGVPAHRRLSDARLRELAPFLPEGTRGGFRFYDARVLAPERLALELALDAARMGATVANHAKVRRIELTDGEVRGVEVEQGGTTLQVPARAVVNAAGPWVDAVQSLTGAPAPELLGVTRGTHVVLQPAQPAGGDAIFSTARSDGRVFFAVPQGDLLLIGTTDERYEGNPGMVAPTLAEVEYLLWEARELLPGLGVEASQVRYAYAGLRPLQRGGGPEAAITRRHKVVDAGEEGGPRGLYNVVGGKLSTFRPLAREVVDTLGPFAEQAPALHAPTRWRDELPEHGLSPRSRRHLRLYGDAIVDVLAGGSGPLCPHTGAVTGEVGHAVRRELATTLSDILMRRTGVAWAACRGLCCHRAAAALAAPLLGWDRAQTEAQVAAFEADVARHLPTMECLMEEVADDNHD